MLKIMRSNKFFTVFLLSAITIMITVAFVFWGIGPRDNPAVSYAAEIGDEKITLEEYYRAYDNEYKRLRDEGQSPEEIEKLNLKERILGMLIDRTVLLIAAEEADINVSEAELREAIVNTPYFQKNGVFSPDVYRRALRLNRTTPQAYESGLKADLIINKMIRLISESAVLTQDEIKILDSMEGGNREQLTEIFLDNRSEQAIQAYINSIKRQLAVKINQNAVL